MLHHAIVFCRKYINRMMNIPLPKLVDGDKSSSQTGKLIKEFGGQHVMVVTDEILVQLGVIKPVIKALEQEKIKYTIFDQVTPDPTVQLVQQGVQLYKDNNCDSFVAIGGGSPIDCAKAIAASAVKNKPVKKLVGELKVNKTLPPFVAIPTTAGTGSEATLVSVITDPATKTKYPIIDPELVPKVAILDPQLMLGLPPHITAATGMDALTHAVESYIGKHSNKFTEDYVKEAVKLIFNSLQSAFDDGSNVEARREMAVASYNAGVAFTRTSVGYVHALAHQLGGYYHIPHGLANAVILPHILELSFDDAYQRYAELAQCAGLASEGDKPRAAARKFVDSIVKLNTGLNIPESFPELKKEDVPTLANRAHKEALFNYPVPTLLKQKHIENVYMACVEA